MDKKELLVIAKLIDQSSTNVASRVADTLGISRQSASAKLQQMKKQGFIELVGTGRGANYHLNPLANSSVTYDRKGLDEDVVWREQCAPIIDELAPNIRGIWHHGITEMVNNAIDHSGAEKVTVWICRDLLTTRCKVIDDGEGIFLKIQRALDLYDAREAILELAKGKLTTDPDNHSGEGIFFSSKMMDKFWIESQDLCFFHMDHEGPDVLLSSKAKTIGTVVFMCLNNDCTRTTKEIFDKFALPSEFSFDKTIVPVKLAQYEGEVLVSRSQSKRLTRRFERFQKVILDFEGVESIGQAFADETFRVFAKAHPDVKMMPTNMTPAVAAMIKRVRNPS